jgi:predicted secreted hydrolase
MIRLLMAALLLASTLNAQYRLALPGYKYEFPRDHFSHRDFQTEWWYWTGNVFDESGRRFGFELTFFRHNLKPAATERQVWDVDDLYLAHLALTDVNGKRFFHTERVNRSGPGLAGVSERDSLIWNGNWRVELRPDRHRMRAVTPELDLELTLLPSKPPATHGVNGVSQKADGLGKASHYVSFTRLETSGKIRWKDGRERTEYAVKGTAWMDHEFFTNQLSDQQVGWDWFAIQLDSGEELMLYRLRKKDGSGDVSSSGTFVDKQGNAKHLSSREFQLKPGSCWQSKQTNGCYPLTWEIEVPGLGISLRSSPALEDQELVSTKGASPTYWEGAMDYTGTRNGTALKGWGYLEMTGYAQEFSFASKKTR